MDTINQKEYLKKYLKIGKGPGEKKKKKKIDKAVQKRLKIIDDDLDVNTALSREIQDDLDAANEDAPQIVAVIDDRPPSLRIDENTKNKLWQPIGQSVDISSAFKSFKMGGIKLIQNKDGPLSGKKDKYMTIKDKITDKSKKYSDNASQEIDYSPKRPAKTLKDDDYSPPRKGGAHFSSNKSQDNSDISPLTNSSKNYSPPRNSNNLKQNDQSPPRKEKVASEKRSHKTEHSAAKNPIQDYSPPRRKSKLNKDTDYSPPRKREEDFSPPRKSKKDYSPPRKMEEDFSPPRKSKKDSPPRKREEDYSPPRKSKKDYSPPRKSKKDNSPPRKREDLSPPRKSKKDYSPPRKTKDDTLKKAKKSRWEENDESGKQDLQKPETTMSGKKSGLQSAKNLTADITQLQKQEEQIFKALPSDLSGANAVTTVRKRKADTVKDPEKEKRNKELQEKYTCWGKGVKQVQDEHEKMADQLKEMNKPLARYADDEDLEMYLKEQEREGDPMLDYIRKKKKTVARQQGVPEKPTYMGDFMPNRFGIKPGYRWDGVNRSNGYEQKWFQVQNSNKAMQEEALQWSTEDM